MHLLSMYTPYTRLVEILAENADWMLSHQQLDYNMVEQFVMGSSIAIAPDEKLIREVYDRLLAMRTGELQQ